VEFGRGIREILTTRIVLMLRAPQIPKEIPIHENDDDAMFVSVGMNPRIPFPLLFSDD